jgi:hypothetical protein
MEASRHHNLTVLRQSSKRLVGTAGTKQTMASQEAVATLLTTSAGAAIGPPTGATIAATLGALKVVQRQQAPLANAPQDDVRCQEAEGGGAATRQLQVGCKSDRQRTHQGVRSACVTV